MTDHNIISELLKSLRFWRFVAIFSAVAMLYLLHVLANSTCLGNTP